jgi:hypothetical protein
VASLKAIVTRHAERCHINIEILGYQALINQVLDLIDRLLAAEINVFFSVVVSL